MNMIEIKELNKSYSHKPVLNELSLDFDQGEIVGLLGPNGCGKSTLMKILAGLISDFQGEVRIQGQKIGLGTKSIISYLPEKTYLSGWMRPVDVFSFFADFYPDFDRVKAEDMLARFHLDARQQIKSMSKGMQEKLQLVLVMSRRASIYLLDEPIGGVDPATRSAILDMVLTNYREDSLMILATHLIQDVEKIFSRAVLLGFNELILDAGIDEIREQHGKSVDEVFREVFKCSLSL